MRQLSLVLAATMSAALLAACAGAGMGTGSSDRTGYGSTSAAAAGSTSMSFFVTSTNPGKGADFGGLAGADQHCQALASAAGAGGKTWRAYLSTTGQGGVNARDRIGRGPWYNAKGTMIAANVDELHGTNQLNKQTALTERGEIVPGGGDPVNTHDVLTGSTPDGRASAGGTQDTTCRNWTSSTDGSAIVGHHDRRGLDTSPAAMSWNSSHGSRGCGMDALRSSGGAGRLYCFATN